MFQSWSEWGGPPSIRTPLPLGRGAFPPDEPCYWEPSQPQEEGGQGVRGVGAGGPPRLAGPSPPLADMPRQCPPGCVLGPPLCWQPRLRGEERALAFLFAWAASGWGGSVVVPVGPLWVRVSCGEGPGSCPWGFLDLWMVASS